MVKLNGGYNMLDLTADDVYVQAKNIVDVQNKKPTFIFDGTNTTAIQTIVLNNDNTITINGELTIATDGTLTPNDYEIKTPHLYRHNIIISISNANTKPLGLQNNTDVIGYGDFYFEYLSTDSTPIDVYDNFEQIETSVDCIIHIDSTIFNGVCRLIPTNVPGDTGYYDVRGILSDETGSEYMYIVFSFDDLDDDNLTITDTVIQLF